jgi:hypothetical protein
MSLSPADKKISEKLEKNRTELPKNMDKGFKGCDDIEDQFTINRENFEQSDLPDEAKADEAKVHLRRKIEETLNSTILKRDHTD